MGWAEILHRLSHPSSLLFVQLIAILVLARVFFVVLQRLRQPAVVGEVLAGIVLGPTLLGAIFPQFQAFLFPPESLRPLELLSDLGIVLFLFLVGMEMDLEQIRARLGQSAVVSFGGIAGSFTLGLLTGFFLHPQYGGTTAPLSFALFLGTAMSITAFPVLARIIRERDLSHSASGIVSLSAAAVGDVLAWCMLALVVGLAQSHTIWTAVIATGGAALFACFMIFVVRPLFARMGNLYITREVIGRGVITFTMLILLSAALISHLIGIHALFGAFLAGAVLPRDTRFRAILGERIEDFISILLLPIFFALTGLRTDLALLLEPGTWIALCLILAASIVGKVVGSGLPARLSGLSWRDAGVVGTLMNTRGLVEIILLNVGFELGILPAPVFAMMVVMALITTFMTGPALHLFREPRAATKGSPMSGAPTAILVPFGPPESGRRLVGVAALFADRVVALHVSPISDSGFSERELTEAEVFGSLSTEAVRTETEIETLHRLTGDLAGTIAVEAQRCGAPLVLIGSARSLFAADVLGGKVADLLRRVPDAMGVFVDRGLAEKPAIAIIRMSPVDDSLLDLAARGRPKLRERLLVLDLAPLTPGAGRIHPPGGPEVLSGDAAARMVTRLGVGDLAVLSTTTYDTLVAEVTRQERTGATPDSIPCSLLIVRPKATA